MMLSNLLPHGLSQLSIWTIIDSESVIAAHDLHFSEFLRVGDRQATEPDRIQQLKDRGIRADPQRQRRHSYEREGRTLPETSQCIAHVAHYSIQAKSRIVLHHALPDHRRVAKSQTRVPLGRLPAHTRRHIVFCAHGYMRSHFV